MNMDILFRIHAYEYGYFISHSFVYMYSFYVVCTVVVSTFLRISLFGYEHDMCAFLGSVETEG